MNNLSDNPTWFLDKLTLYQAANSTPEAIKRNFLIRIAEFELILSDLRRKKPADPVQHELILGRRGSGKSTLLRRIQIEIDEDAELAKQYIAINLAEEQAAIYRLSDLWFEVLAELMTRLNAPKKLRDFDDFDDNQAYTRYLYAEIHQLLESSKKKIVLLLDNLDRILENFDADGHLLRETLLNHNDLQIIGGSTRMDEHFWRYDQPFYEFFRRHRLEGLHFEEIERLLDHWSAEMNLPELQGYAQRYRGRIEAIRILTDGLPRALQFFIQVLLQDSAAYGFDYLRKVMDRATPLYQERLNSLTAPQRKIVQEMAFWWEAAPTKTLVEKCRMESKLIASYLKQLEHYGIVETLTTGKKNHLYRISERFFNMWLIVTQGNPDQKRRAKYLTLFLEAWYDGEELKILVKQHLENLREGKVTYDKALVLSKGFAQSKFIGVEERDALIEYTTKLDTFSDINSELPRRFKEIFKDIEQLKKENKFAECLIKVEEIENEGDGIKMFLKAFCFYELGRFKEAEDYYLQSIEKGYTSALNNLGKLYREQGKHPEAERYYLEAIKKGGKDAMYNLAMLYYKQGNVSKAEQYFKNSIENGQTIGLNNLGILMAEQGRISEAELYFKIAIDNGDVIALNNLGNLYLKSDEIGKAENYFIQAIEKDSLIAIFNLAYLYSEQQKNAESKFYYLRAIKKGYMPAYNNLAFAYYTDNENAEEALDYINQYYSKTLDRSSFPNLIIIEIWSGIFNNLPQKIEQVIQNSKENDNDLTWFLTNLLYLEQKQLVLSLFESEQHGKMLKTRYELLYYATLILSQKTDDNLLLRIPPEVMPTVEDIVEKVKEKQAFYAAKQPEF